MDNVERKNLEAERRQKLKEEKPLVYNKIIKYDEKFKNGECIAIIDFAYSDMCNMKCKHCSSSSFSVKKCVMKVKDVENLSAQADELGLAQFNISGGEPLMFPELDDIIIALQPDKFHLSMSTNGILLDKEKARHLKKAGLDKVKISLDSIDPFLHEENRNKKGVFNKAYESLFNAKEAGMSVVIQTVLTKQNARTEATVRLAEFAAKNGFAVDVMLVKAIGRLEGPHEFLCAPEDVEFIDNLHKEYPSVYRDIIPSYGMDRGCGTVRNTLHITKYGDVLPCVFIHISIGNIFEEPLKDIIDRGLRIKHFHDYSPICLAGEDRNFIEKYMNKFYGKPLPISYKEAFEDYDYVDNSR
jgi:MoaA/NifB/PqqE/SkfB family radical SAM enzyme